MHYYELQTLKDGLPKGLRAGAEGGIFFFSIMLTFTGVSFGDFLFFTLIDAQSRSK